MRIFHEMSGAIHSFLSCFSHGHKCVGKMWSKVYSFCLEFIMVADCQEGPQKKPFSQKTVCVDCMDGLVHECDNEMCVV